MQWWVSILLLLNGATSEELNIVWMVPDRHPLYNISSSIGPLALALKRIRDQQMLPGYNINITWLDSACSSQKSIGHLTEYLTQRRHISVVVGPPCVSALQPVANLAGYYDIPVFTWMSREHTVDDKSTYDTLVRTRPPISSLVYMFHSISERFNWSRAAILYTDEVPSTKTLALAMITKFTEDKEFNLVTQYIVSLYASDRDLHRIFKSIKNNARIIFLMIPRAELRRYMLALHDSGMTNGEYQYLYTEMDLSELSELSSQTLWRADDGRDDDARGAFGSLLYFTFMYLAGMNSHSELITEAYEEIFSNSSFPKPAALDFHSAFLYDALILYALAFNETITDNKTTNGLDIFKAVQYKSFTGLSGEVFMNEMGDRFPSFVVWDLGLDGRFQVVLTLNYTPGQPGAGPKYNKTIVQYHDIIWGDGTTSSEYIPPDTPVCGFYDEFCPPDISFTVLLATTMSIALLLIVIAAVAIGRWWRREKEIYQMVWNVAPSEIDYNFRKNRRKSLTSVGAGSTMSDSVSTYAGSSTLGSYGLMLAGASLCDSRIKLARYRSTIVVVKIIRKSKIKFNRELLIHMRELFSLKHPNLATLAGLCVEIDSINVLWEYCMKGSLQDLVDNSEKMKLEGAFQFSIANDICGGLAYIHGGPIKYHGDLKSTNCVVDNHWACKLTDFGMTPLKRDELLETELSENEKYSRLFWLAPECVRMHVLNMPITLSQQADVYALGVILKELICLNRPYAEQNRTPKEIVQHVAHPVDNLMRPEIPDVHDDQGLIRKGFKKLISSCWAEDPHQRPPIKKIVLTIKHINPYRSATVLDNMFMMMERYSGRLEEVVSALEDEKRKTDALLYKMLPKTVADELKLGNHVKAEYYDAVTVYFSDIVGFTSLAAESTPMQIVDFLNSLYSLFDDIIQRYDVYKVETIGDAYMVASGLPVRNGEKHVTEMADVSLTLLKCVLNFQIPHKPDKHLLIRIGLHTGPAVAGVVGLTMPRYCLFGDTVNTASRMESNARPMLIHITPDTQKILKQNPQYAMLERGKVHIKGKGLMETFWLVGKKGLYEIPDAVVKEQVAIAAELDQFKRLSQEQPDKKTSEVDIPDNQHGKPQRALTRRGHHSMSYTKM